LLSNDGLNVDGLERTWLRYVVGGLPEVVVAMDWTDGSCGPRIRKDRAV
jgi:hypothetical protein